MEKRCRVFTALTFFLGFFCAVQGEQRATKSMKKRPAKETPREQRGNEKSPTPYQVAKNISTAINFLTDYQDMMTDNEKFVRTRRKLALDMYRAEAFCVITMASRCFPVTKEGDITKHINWVPAHPLLGKDVYAEGVLKFINLNYKYNNERIYKANQSAIARDKVREVIHENLFSIIDRMNKIESANLLPGEFYYSGHPYTGVAPTDHISLYKALSDLDKVDDLSALDSCHHIWQAALYRNLFYLIKLVARRVLKSAENNDNITDDDKNILRGISRPVPGDEDLALPDCH